MKWQPQVTQCHQLSVLSFKPYLLNTCCVPGTTLGFRAFGGEKPDSDPSSVELTV